MLLDYLDYLNNLFAEIGNQDMRFVGLHNTYSPEPIVITSHRSPKPGQESKGISPQMILMGHPVNSWPLPEMKVTPEPKAVF